MSARVGFSLLEPFEKAFLNSFNSESQAAKTGRALSRFFLEQVTGYKLLAKMTAFTGKGLQISGYSFSPPVVSLIQVCEVTKDVITATEPYSKLSRVFKPMHQYSIWSDEKETISLPALVLTKSADIANWTMSTCDTYKWLSKLGFVAVRESAKNIFSLASAVYVTHGLRTEGAKWWTGRVVNPLNGKTTDFTTVEKVKSILSFVVLFSYGTMTAIAFSQLAGFVVANAAVWNFALLGSATTGTLAGHLWENMTGLK